MAKIACRQENRWSPLSAFASPFRSVADAAGGPCVPSMFDCFSGCWNCITRRTAGCGSARPVAWEGRRGNPPPYPDTLPAPTLFLFALVPFPAPTVSPLPSLRADARTFSLFLDRRKATRSSIKSSTVSRTIVRFYRLSSHSTLRFRGMAMFSKSTDWGPLAFHDDDHRPPYLGRSDEERGEPNLGDQ